MLSYSRLPQLVLAFAIAAAVTATSSMGWAQDTSPKGISVTGQGEVSASPDMARLSLGVTTQDKDAAKAVSENAKLSQKIIGAIAGAGIARKDIQTSQYSLQAMFDYKQSPPKLTGYQASNVVSVTIRDLSKVGNIIDQSIAAGANNVQGVSFEIENDSVLRDDALKQAAKAASTKAHVIAEALGVKLGGLRAANENVARPSYPIAHARMEAAAPAPETPVLPGQITITATVSLVYDIAQ
jgi:uncharacterized protein